MNRRKVNFKYEEYGQVAGTTATDKNDLEDHRASSFQSLGFSKEDSKQLAEAKHRTNIGEKIYDFPLSWHYVKKMLDSGCSHDLALKILL